MQIVSQQTDIAIAEYWAEQPLYCHLVTDLPSPLFSLAAELAIASGGNYSPISLTGVRYEVEGLGVRLLADPVSWISLTTNGTAITGAAFFNQQGQAISSSDMFFGYMGFTDSEGDSMAWVPDGRTLSLPLNEKSFFRTRI